jgi:hypothetical protein
MRARKDGGKFLEGRALDALQDVSAAAPQAR